MGSKTAKTPRSQPAPKPQTRTVDVLEFLASAPKVDAENGIVYGVKLLGRVSKNGHEYSDRALRDAAKVYEGNVVNLDHPPDRNATAERSVRERFGIIRNPETRITGDPETDGVYGDHHFPLKHSYTPEYLEILERFPQSVGFSHNAVVTESVKDGKVTFDSVQRARSIDLVANPATTRGIFESEEVRMDPNDPNYVAPTMEDAPGDEAGEPSTEESLDQAFELAIMAIVRDGDMTLDQKKEKIAALLDIHNDVSGDGDGDEDEPKDEPKDAPKDEPPKKDDTESVNERLAKLEAQDKARSVLESKGLRPSRGQVKAFSALESEDEQSEFIDTLKAAEGKTAATPPKAPAAKPRSVPANALESTKPAATSKPDFAVPKSHDDLKAITGQLVQ